MIDSNPASATATPKRKHSQMVTEDIVIPSSVTTEASLEEQNGGNYSPRTRVTHRFQNLTIRHGSGAKDFDTLANELQRPLLAVEPTYVLKDDAQGDAMDEDTDYKTGPRKRFKPLEPSIPHAPTIENLSAMIPPGASRQKPGVSVSFDRTGTPSPTSSPGKQRSSPSKPDSRPASRVSPPLPRKADLKRASPLPSQQHVTASTSPSPEAPTTSPPDFRASLTWQEEEITIYDPEDSDDDGTGINGIGFKPTAAVAYARGIKRKQQLAEYRKREEREARARRNMRRRGTPTPVPEGVTAKDKVDRGKDREGSRRKIATKERRVRFLEANVAGAEAVKASQ